MLDILRDLDQSLQTIAALSVEGWSGMRDRKGQADFNAYYKERVRMRDKALEEAGFVTPFDREFAVFWRWWNDRFQQGPDSSHGFLMPSGRKLDWHTNMVWQLRKQLKEAVKRYRSADARA